MQKCVVYIFLRIQFLILIISNLILIYYLFINFSAGGYVVDGVLYHNTTTETTPRSGSITMREKSSLPWLWVNLAVLMLKMIIVTQKNLWLELKGAKTMDSRFSIIILEFSRSVLNLSSHVQFNTFMNIFIQWSKNAYFR